MKKGLIPLVLGALLCFSGATEPSRFATPEEMGKALLSAFQKNDSARFLQLYPSRAEADAAFAEPWKDSSLYDHQVQWVNKFYNNKSELARQMFRETRKKITDAGYDWKDVQFISVDMRKENKRSPGIDYLYRADVNLIAKNTFRIELDLSDVMKTKDGWNCGLILKNPFIETAEVRAVRDQMNAEADRLIDSLNRADVIKNARVQLVADSLRLVDSIVRVHHERDQQEQQKKKPK